MITERKAVSMIENEIPQSESRRLEIRNLYQFMQAYATLTCDLGERSLLNEFETQLCVANQLYSEGSKNVKEAMEQVYISTLSHSLELKPELLSLARRNLSGSLLNVMYRNQRVSYP